MYRERVFALRDRELQLPGIEIDHRGVAVASDQTARQVIAEVDQNVEAVAFIERRQPGLLQVSRCFFFTEDVERDDIAQSEGSQGLAETLITGGDLTQAAVAGYDVQPHDIAATRPECKRPVDENPEVSALRIGQAVGSAESDVHGRDGRPDSRLFGVRITV